MHIDSITVLIYATDAIYLIQYVTMKYNNALFELNNLW